MVREFFRTLFGSRYICRLEQNIEELKNERDYFRGKCEKLELKILTPPPPIIRPPLKMEPVRKSLAQLQEELRLQEILQEKQKETH